jgi:ubiquinone/menaquinone biosynthesis C-methylase UbiE
MSRSRLHWRLVNSAWFKIFRMTDAASSNPSPVANQCRRPSGWFGRLVLRNMNSRHSGVTDWGLSHITVDKRSVILDIGCGGGRTIQKFATAAAGGKIRGIDHSSDSVAVASKTNESAIKAGQVEIGVGSVSQLPFSADTFDLVSAVETHFFWPDLPNDVREVLRVLKPGGTFVLIAEIYKGANTTAARLCEKHASKSGMTLLTLDEHRALLETGGFRNVEVHSESKNGWVCCTGQKPAHSVE